MYLQFPFAQLVRHRRMAMREFVVRAETIAGARDDCLLEASDHGLTLLARNEEALASPRQVLQEVFATDIEIEPIRVRLAPSTPPRSSRSCTCACGGTVAAAAAAALDAAAAARRAARRGH